MGWWKSMAKIFVDVFTPGNGKTYEFQLSDNITVNDANSRMVEEILQIEENSMSFNEPTLLCDLPSCRILPGNASLSAVIVKSGNKLLLV